MRKILAWLRLHPFVAFGTLTVGVGAAVLLYVQAPTRLDREHGFNEIKMGMTVGEVERILGGPPGRFGIPNGWLANTWFRWKGRNGDLRMTSFAMGDWQRRDAASDVFVWQLTTFDRFANISVFLDEHGKVMRPIIDDTAEVWASADFKRGR